MPLHVHGVVTEDLLDCYRHFRNLRSFCARDIAGLLVGHVTHPFTGIAAYASNARGRVIYHYMLDTIMMSSSWITCSGVNVLIFTRSC